MENLDNFCYWLEELPLTLKIGESWIFPLLESIHVIAAVVVVGTIVVVDLRLLGFAANRYTVSTMLRESIRWTWVAFVIALITGVGMFVTRASGYIHNPAFLWKMALLVLAAINMLYFHRRVWPQYAQSSAMPLTFNSKLAGALSLCLWIGVTLSGRWIGHIL